MDKRDLQKLLAELLDDESDKMTSWELEFIDSLNKQNHNNWSDRQCEILQEVWDKVFNG